MRYRSEYEARRALVEACREMTARGINQGTSGNISVRYEDRLLISPSGIPYDTMAPDDVISMDMAGTWKGVAGNVPSSEWRFHLDVMNARPDVNAVVHAHPIHATIIAIMGRSIPPLHYMIAVGGGHDIPCAPYATYGTAELSRHAVKALTERHVCLLANHGMIATGATLAKAMWRAVEVEVLAHQYHGCLQLGGPTLLSAEQIDEVLEKWGEYGFREPETR